MANEISIVVRTQDAASRGFRGIGQAALGMNSAIESASSALDSLDAIQQSGANKAAARAQAQNDVAQALVDQKQAELDLKQATLDANQATLDASEAKTDYADAVKEFGKNSQEAKQAQADLSQAEYDSAQATADMKQAQVDATQAQIDLNAAQRELNPTLVQQASQRFQELAPAVGLAAMAAGQMSSMMSITRVRTLAAAAATRTMAIAQRILNVAMRANPIGIVITVLTLLVGSLIYAYNHSSRFRAIVQAAFRAAQGAGRIMLAALRSTLADLGSKLSAAWGKFQTFYRVSRAAMNSLLSAVRSIVARIKSVLGSIFGPWSTVARGAVWVVINALKVMTAAAREAKAALGAIKGGGIPFVPGFAHGGVTGSANGASPSGMTMVGEQGPELLQLPPGTRVRSNPDTRAMSGGGSGGGSSVITIRLEGTGILDGLRKTIRVQGGDVQTVLGR